MKERQTYMHTYLQIHTDNSTHRFPNKLEHTHSQGNKAKALHDKQKWRAKTHTYIYRHTKLPKKFTIFSQFYYSAEFKAKQTHRHTDIQKNRSTHTKSYIH